ncbi:MAG: hypothetical protein HZB23_01840 [Deltaproteobacteria bacterium]|nr:hypothetical protein [Deltaproteobacteria bacterium]
MESPREIQSQSRAEERAIPPVVVRWSFIVGLLCWLMFIVFQLAMQNLRVNHVLFHDDFRQIARYYLMIVFYLPIIVLYLMFSGAIYSNKKLYDAKKSYIPLFFVIFLFTIYILSAFVLFDEKQLFDNTNQYLIIRCIIIYFIIFLFFCLTLIRVLKLKKNTVIDSSVFTLNILLLMTLLQFMIISYPSHYSSRAIADLRNAFTASEAFFTDNPGKPITVRMMEESGFVHSQGVQIKILDAHERTLDIVAQFGSDHSDESGDFYPCEIRKTGNDVKISYLWVPSTAELLKSIIPVNLTIITFR